MKSIIVLTLVFAASAVSADIIADGNIQRPSAAEVDISETEIQTANVDGKIDAALTAMCLNDYPSFRNIMLIENKVDLAAMDRLQIKADQHGDSAWFSGLGQLIYTTTSLQDRLSKPLTHVSAERCDAIMSQRAEISSVLMRAPKYR